MANIHKKCTDLRSDYCRTTQVDWTCSACVSLSISSPLLVSGKAHNRKRKRIRTDDDDDSDNEEHEIQKVCTDYCTPMRLTSVNKLAVAPLPLVSSYVPITHEKCLPSL